MIEVDFQKKRGEEVGTDAIWQWDINQKLRILGLDLPTTIPVDFSLKEAGNQCVYSVGTTTDGITEVNIPDQMTENESAKKDYYIYAFISVTDGETTKTIRKIVIPVKARPKPGTEHELTPDEENLFYAAIEQVNDCADRAKASENDAETAAELAEEAKNETAQMLSNMGLSVVNGALCTTYEEV